MARNNTTPAAAPSNVAPGTQSIAPAPAGARAASPFSGVYWPLVSHDIRDTNIDQSIPAGASPSFDVIGAVFYCFECDKADVYYKFDDAIHDKPLRPGAGMNYLLASQVFGYPLLFKRLTIINKSTEAVHVRLYAGMGIPSEYKDILAPGETALPVADAAVENNTEAILSHLEDCCPQILTALGDINTSINGLADAIGDVISKITVSGGNTMIPYPTYQALADAVTAGMQPATLAQVVIAAGAPPTLETWQLRADAGAHTAGDITQAPAGIVIPADYDPAANARIWFRV